MYQISLSEVYMTQKSFIEKELIRILEKEIYNLLRTGEVINSSTLPKAKELNSDYEASPKVCPCMCHKEGTYKDICCTDFSDKPIP